MLYGLNEIRESLGELIKQIWRPSWGNIFMGRVMALRGHWRSSKKPDFLGAFFKKKFLPLSLVLNFSSVRTPLKFLRALLSSLRSTPANNSHNLYIKSYAYRIQTLILTKKIKSWTNIEFITKRRNLRERLWICKKVRIKNTQML